MTGILQAFFAGSPNIRYSSNYTFSANSTNTTITVSSLANYAAGKTDILITVNAGIYVYSTVNASPALTISGGATGDTIKIINNGFIVGLGGNGAQATGSGTFSGAAGGPAISLTAGGPSVTIDNTNASAYIGGGGGGGSSNGSAPPSQNGGGGGGAGGGNGASAGDGTYPGGTGGFLGNSGAAV